LYKQFKNNIMNLIELKVDGKKNLINLDKVIRVQPFSYTNYDDIAVKVECIRLYLHGNQTISVNMEYEEFIKFITKFHEVII
jgi:hypothetical protein